MNKNFVLKVAVFFILFVAIESILSKSDKINEEQVYFIPPVSDDEYSEDFLIDETEVIDSIFQNEYKLDLSEKNYNGVTLAYVTPWNNHGYDVVKLAAKKFDLIAPVWFTIKFVEKVNTTDVQINGQHDIDQEWMNDIRTNNSNVKFTPRFLFNHFDQQTFNSFLYKERLQERIMDEILYLLRELNCDGAVLELWIQIIARAREAEPLLIEVVEYFGKRLKEHNMISIITLTPILDSKLNDIKIISEESLTRLGEAVDFINLMAYDYSPNTNFHPIAPMYWVEANLACLYEASVPKNKILLGLNWYGYEYSIEGSDEPKIVTKREFIKSIEEEDAKLIYENNLIKENHIFLRTKQKIVYYPTLKSIKERIKHAEEFELGGIAIWDIGQGLDHFTSVL